MKFNFLDHFRVILLLAGVGLAACMAETAPSNASGPFRPGGEGIDVSHHNGKVDWPRVALADLDFVYLKATEGETHKDPAFQKNWRGALEQGFAVGAYHFYLMCKPGAAQAENFIQSVEVRGGALPPAVDLEYAHNCTSGLTRDATLDELRAFLAALEAEYGAKPMLYTTPEFHRDWLASGFETYPIWMRDLSGAPELPHQLWQYSMKGRVPGIDGAVDLNRVSKSAP